LRAALNDAQKWGLRTTNPATLVRAPRPARSIPNPLSRDEVSRVFAAAQHEPLEQVFVVALFTGLRLSELLGLRWADLDEVSGTLLVRRTRRPDGTIGEPKSAAGRRDIDVPMTLVGSLAQVRRSRGASPDAPMFIMANGGLPAHRHVQAVWARILRTAEVEPRTFHQLRKTYASLLVERGVDVRTAQELLGHADVRMTLQLYARTSRSARQAAADQIGHGLPPLTSDCQGSAQTPPPALTQPEEERHVHGGTGMP
jgi:integrase